MDWSPRGTPRGLPERVPGGFPCKMDGCSSFFLGVAEAVLVALEVLSFKKSTTEAFAVRRILSRKKCDGRYLTINQFITLFHLHRKTHR